MLNDPSLEDALRDVMRRRVEALRARNVAALADLLADDFTYTNSQGALWRKQGYLDFVERGAMRFEQQTVDEMLVRAYGGVAVVTCRVQESGTWEGSAFKALLRSTQVYVRRGSAWLYVAGQTTRIAED